MTPVPTKTPARRNVKSLWFLGNAQDIGVLWQTSHGCSHPSVHIHKKTPQMLQLMLFGDMLIVIDRPTSWYNPGTAEILSNIQIYFSCNSLTRNCFHKTTPNSLHLFPDVFRDIWMPLGSLFIMKLSCMKNQKNILITESAVHNIRRA